MKWNSTEFDRVLELTTKWSDLNRWEALERVEAQIVAHRERAFAKGLAFVLDKQSETASGEHLESVSGGSLNRRKIDHREQSYAEFKEVTHFVGSHFSNLLYDVPDPAIGTPAERAQKMRVLGFRLMAERTKAGAATDRFAEATIPLAVVGRHKPTRERNEYWKILKARNYTIASIRDYWNGLPQSERERICPQSPGKVQTDTVKKALKSPKNSEKT